MTTVLVPRGTKLGEGFSLREQVKALEHLGRRTDGTQSAAHWILNLSDLQKVIQLCGWCRPKFNPRKHGYRKFYAPDPTGITDGYQPHGLSKCDACKQMLGNRGGGVAYIREDTYNLTCVDPLSARRAARAKARRAWMTAADVAALMRKG